MAPPLPPLAAAKSSKVARMGTTVLRPAPRFAPPAPPRFAPLPLNPNKSPVAAPSKGQVGPLSPRQTPDSHIIDLYSGEWGPHKKAKRVPLSETSRRTGTDVKHNKYWHGLVRYGTCFIPDFLLVKCGYAHHLERIAWREKFFTCSVLALVYVAVLWTFVVYPLTQCSGRGNAVCTPFQYLTYTYMATKWFAPRTFVERDNYVILHIPCYSEDAATLKKTIDSCVDSTYNKDKKILWIVADGLVVGSGNNKCTGDIVLEDVLGHDVMDTATASDFLQYFSCGHSLEMVENVASVYHGTYRGVRYIVTVKTGLATEQNAPKPANRGKRDSQLLIYKFLNHVNTSAYPCALYTYLNRLFRSTFKMNPSNIDFLLVADTDTKIDPIGISYLVDQLVKDESLVGVCGETQVENGLESFIASTQVFEYWLTHALLKAFESVFSKVLVLSGCFTVYRLKRGRAGRLAILDNRILDDYSANYTKTLHEHNLLTIGEDRYLSLLCLRFLPDMSTKYFSRATCTTAAPTSLSVLLDQRRRWTNSLVHCHSNLLRDLPYTSLWNNVKLVFVVMIELWLVFMQPLVLPIGTVMAWWGLVQYIHMPYVIALTLCFFFLPMFLPLLCGQPRLMLWWFPFLLATPIYSVMIPMYSLWRSNDFRWGLTRKA